MYFARKNPTSEMQAEQTSQSKEYPPSWKAHPYAQCGYFVRKCGLAGLEAVIGQADLGVRKWFVFLFCCS